MKLSFWSITCLSLATGTAGAHVTDNDVDDSIARRFLKAVGVDTDAVESTTSGHNKVLLNINTSTERPAVLSEE